MGISGLLPALKSIQVTKHLSEYAGKTIAVDAYVWLHRGVYSCATELATGKPTHKYVDYAMHRVRLLRHYKIEPYVVFDGGPLPAKKGTESDRKKKRDENLARGKAFAVQGKHTQARECFVKCVDVTPQMAFQFIKALRAESVPYVVAPYEADAQLAYLERTGVVDAILTEDSDLLVFGCQTVLFKLDAVASTVISISRSDFGSVSEPGGISLIGWSDTQFRAMTILSGCDYLPSIPGIGLKTACALLKKWRTPEQVVKAIQLEGKKVVPRGYTKQYQLAEKCFLHQRVYCPSREKLVHLSEVGEDWKDEYDDYVGGDMDPALVKSIALGDADPVTYLPMTDINSSFKPRALKSLPLHNKDVVPQSAKGKGKMRESLPAPLSASKTGKAASTGGIYNFFGPNPVIPRATAISKKPLPTVVSRPVLGNTGKASGKRTLAEVMDQDMERKKKAARKSHSPAPTVRIPVQSKFFASTKSNSIQRRHSDIIAGPSRLPMHGADKENVYIMVDDDDDLPADVLNPEEELDGSDVSLAAQFDVDVGMEDVDDDFSDPVKQEDGYISPSPSDSKDADDLSSPLQPGQYARFKTRSKWKQDQEPGQTGVVPSDDDGSVEEENSFGADPVSSPISVKRPKNKPGFDSRQHAYQTPTRWGRSGDRLLEHQQDVGGQEKIMVAPTPTPTTKKRRGIYPDIEDVPSPIQFLGPDLRSMLGDDGATELDLQDPGWECEEVGEEAESRRHEFGTDSDSAPDPSPETPNIPPAEQQPKVLLIEPDVFDALDDYDNEAQRAEDSAMRANAVMNGWRDKWAHSSDKNATTAATSRSSIPGQKSSRHPATKPKTLRPSNASNLRRNETNVTPAGRHSLGSRHPRSAPPKFVGVDAGAAGDAASAKAKPRRSLLFFEAVSSASRTKKVAGTRKGQRVIDLSFDSDADESFEAPRCNVPGSPQNRLSQFRYNV